MRALSECVPATGGVLIQFPFYAVIFGMIVGTGIADVLAELVRSHQHPQHLSAGSGNVFGGAWSFYSFRRQQMGDRSSVCLAGREPASRCIWDVGVDLQRFGSVPNLVNPFWMLPLFGILKLKARDIVGYEVLQLMVHVPVVFFLCWLFARYMP